MVTSKLSESDNFEVTILSCQVRLLVESGANKDQGKTDTGATPFYIAAEKGQLEVVRFLVESGANKDQGKTDDGMTPLCIAAQDGHLEVVRFLLESGASKDQGTTDEGATPLYIAAQNGHLEVVRIGQLRGDHSELPGPIVGQVGCQQRPRQDRWWSNVSFHSSWEWAPWSCPISL